MNGLPRVALSSRDRGSEATKSLKPDELIKVILSCEEFKMRKYLKAAQREER